MLEVSHPPDAPPDLYNPIYPLVCVGLALATARLLRGRRLVPVNVASSGRYETVDGLRGFLAFAVFLHHAVFWFVVVRAGKWRLPSSHLFAHFGQSSVLLFFMITGLLFFSKVRASREKPIDWLRVYVSRLLRLGPVYFVMLALLGLIIAIEGRFMFHEPKLRLLRHIGHWLLFCCIDSPALNGFGNTWLVTAGVTWTLQFEWLFYLALPLIACATAPRRWVVASALCLLGFVFAAEFYKSTVLFAFGSGMFAALCCEEPRIVRLARSPWGNLFSIGPLVFAVAYFPVAYAWGPPMPLPADFYVLALMTVAFIAIAGGSTLFGLLRHPICKALGDLSYGIYLLHGIVLYVVFRFIVGIPRAASLSVFEFWSIIAASGVFLTALASLAYRYLEQPALGLTGRVTSWVRHLGRGGRAVAPVAKQGSVAARPTPGE